MASNLEYRLDCFELHEDDDPQRIGVYIDLDVALVAAESAIADLSEFRCSTRFLIYPVDQGDLPFGDHEILVARRPLNADEARKGAEAIVDAFDRAWLVISSLRNSVRERARTELVEAIVGGFMAHD